MNEIIIVCPASTILAGRDRQKLAEHGHFLPVLYRNQGWFSVETDG